MSHHHHHHGEGPHGHAHPPARRPAIAGAGGSLLRASAPARLAGALAAILVIWAGVLWAVA